MASPRRLSDEAVNRAAEKSKIKLRVFVGGPYIDLSWKRAPPRKLYDGAQYLRYKVCRHVSDVLGYKVTVGESRPLEEIYKEYFSGRYNSALMEIAHIIDEVDAVIIIPSSPGSFLELGYFAASRKVSNKMLVLRNVAFAKKPGYLHLGPSRQAKDSGAIIHDVDYAETRGVLKKVDDFLEDRVSSMLARKYMVD